VLSPCAEASRSIAQGHNRNSEISNRTQLEPAHVTKILNTLERLELVDRPRPVTASARSKKIAYRISDPFPRFHCRFVEPARSQLCTTALAAAINPNAGTARRFLFSRNGFTARLAEHASQRDDLILINPFDIYV